jgi:CDP-diacylglycerol--glycerol-3-phosphate 3-phosphatidyltransferase
MTVLPVLVLGTLFTFLVGYAVFRRRRALGAEAVVARRAPTAFVTQGLMEYVYWLVAPAERALVASGVSPNLLTIAGLVVSIAAGAFAAGKDFALAGSLYFLGGALDVLDGRVARRAGRSSAAGALLDSVCDRWGEFVVMGGIGFAVRNDAVALAGVLLTIAGSQMVSYTRARAEALGVSLAIGLMQRSERVVLIGLGLVVAGGAEAFGARAPLSVLTATLVFVGTLSTFTAIRRLFIGMAGAQKRGG